ncbi:hypothetical protein BDB01DRAFT_834203 [Pilobolus umbonatus]|nr:hypothetical protein BDB01DRAFT_834203 [Pilobolus umbonatus]
MDHSTIIPQSKNGFIRWLQLDQLDARDVVGSQWISDKALFIIRFILTLYSVIVLWVDIGMTAHEGHFRSFFSYFTHLTFIGLHAYLVTATVIGFRALRSKSVSFVVDQYAILNYLYVYLYHTVITFNVVTPVVYWALLANTSGDEYDMWMNVSVHGVSLGLILIDIVFNRMQVYNRMVILVLITVIAYMLMAFIIYASDGYWVYDFLDWNKGPTAAIWYVAVAAIVVVSFFIQKLLHMLRDKIARKSHNKLTDEEKQEIA